MGKEEKSKRINSFRQTKSQSKKFDSSIKSLPKSEHYREKLEPLLGAVVDIVCENWEIKNDIIDGTVCSRILLLDAEIVKCPKSREVHTPVYISHIWTVVDSDWATRMDIKSTDCLKLRGFVYLYESKNKKNIGLQTLTIRKLGHKAEGV